MSYISYGCGAVRLRHPYLSQFGQLRSTGAEDKEKELAARRMRPPRFAGHLLRPSERQHTWAACGGGHLRVAIDATAPRSLPSRNSHESSDPVRLHSRSADSNAHRTGDHDDDERYPSGAPGLSRLAAASPRGIASAR